MQYLTNSSYEMRFEADVTRTVPESCRSVDGNPFLVALLCHVHGGSKDLTGFLAVNMRCNLQLACRSMVTPVPQYIIA